MLKIMIIMDEAYEIYFVVMDKVIISEGVGSGGIVSLVMVVDEWLNERHKAIGW